VVKLLVGLLKGAVIGGAIGYGAFAIGFNSGALAWITYGLVGLLVGLLVGRPLWSLIKDTSATTWAGVLKAAFGFGVGCGLYALIAKVWNPALAIADMPWSQSTILGGAIGAVYGAFVEIDDAIGSDDKAKAAAKPAKKPAKQPE
jgi:hypothetical protein